MKNKIPSALEDCLQEVHRRNDLNAALAHHPELGEHLRPLLQTARAASQYGQDPISLKSVREGRARLLAQVDEARRQPKSRFGLVFFRRFPVAAGLVLSCFVLAGTGLIGASASSLPGDPLYGIKRTTENVQLQLAVDPSQKVALQDQFSHRRVDEAVSLLVSQRIEQVDFSGLVEIRLADGWQVEGIHVILDAQTQLSGVIQPGAVAEVLGTTQANESVLASSITVETNNEENNGDANPPGSGGAQEESGPSSTATMEPTQWGETTTPGWTESGDQSGGSRSSSPTPGWNSEGDHEDHNGTLQPSRTPWPTKTPGPTSTDNPSRTPNSTGTNEPND